MNASNARDYLPLVQALADGKVVQYRLPSNNGWIWSTGGDVDFTLPADQYRIKPEPREIWVNRTPCGFVAVLTWGSEDEARKHAIEGTNPIRFREVIE